MGACARLTHTRLSFLDINIGGRACYDGWDVVNHAEYHHRNDSCAIGRFACQGSRSGEWRAYRQGQVCGMSYRRFQRFYFGSTTEGSILFFHRSPARGYDGILGYISQQTPSGYAEFLSHLHRDKRCLRLYLEFSQVMLQGRESGRLFAANSVHYIDPGEVTYSSFQNRTSSGFV